jgi:hypothetical protein
MVSRIPRRTYQYSIYNLDTSDPNDPDVIIKIDVSNAFNTTPDFCQRVVFGDLLLHLGSELWFRFCTRTITCGTKTEP